MILPALQNALVLTGPTGSGKSALAIELAERMNAEIIAMDSMTLYRGMNIGTAKPTLEDRARIPHHLIDSIDPWTSAHVAWWLTEAEKVYQDMEARGKQALFVGGTPFYLKSLMAGLFDSPPVDVTLRQSLEERALKIGNQEIHRELAAIDPVSAKRLHPNDVRRMIRALEVYHLTGKPLSAWQQQEGWEQKKENTPEISTLPDGTPQYLVLDLPREELYNRINLRVETMLSSGWIEEVESLRNLPYPLSKEASQALGYQEIVDYLDGMKTLNETREWIQIRTRQYAKRQLTWFRHLPGCLFSDRKNTFVHWHRKIM